MMDNNVISEMLLGKSRSSTKVRTGSSPLVQDTGGEASASCHLAVTQDPSQSFQAFCPSGQSGETPSPLLRVLLPKFQTLSDHKLGEGDIFHPYLSSSMIFNEYLLCARHYSRC